MSQTISRSRNYCFTLNNFTLEERVHLAGVACHYMVLGEEVGESGTPHLQGFVYFKDAKTLAAAKQALGPRVHLEAMKGTQQQAIEYCKKDSKWVDYGKEPLAPKDKGAKEKLRWAEAMDEAKATGEVSDPQIALQFCRSVDYIHNRELTKRSRVDTEQKMLWYWGASGTGKSRKAREDHPEAYLKMCNKWWDGYRDEEVVLIEDYDKAHSVLGHHLKIWADRYPFLAEVKGAARKVRPGLIIVTSNWHPSQIWQDDETLGPIMRRFDCVEFSKMEEWDLN